MSDLTNKVITSLRKVLPDTRKKYLLHEPYFNGREWEYVKDCLDIAWVSSAGNYVDEFESKIQEYTGAKYAIAVVNGTAALHIALQLAGVKKNEEVLVPALSFVASSNAIVYCGAVPHFVDCEERTLGLDPLALREYLLQISEFKNNHCINRQTGSVIRAVVPVHTFGHPVDMEGLLSVAHDYNLVIVEDAAESIGSTYHDKHTGTFGLLGILSFNGNKIITTGGGGIILTDDKEIASRAKHTTTTAKLPHRWEYQHDEVGYNYRLPNINAALGCAQLEQLPSFLESKRRIFESYKKAFDNVTGIKLVSEPEHSKSNYWLQTLLLDESEQDKRDLILEATNDAGIMTRPAWTLLNRLPPYINMPGMDLCVAESLENRLINIPSSSQLDL